MALITVQHFQMSEGLRCPVYIIIPQNIAESLVLDEYALKMPLDIQNGSLGAEDEQFKKWDPF